MISSALLLNAASAIASITKRDSQALISPESEEEAITSILCSACEALSFKDAEEEFLYRIVLACGVLIARRPEKARVLFESLG